MASISTPTPHSNCCVVIQLSAAGWKKAVQPEMRAHTGNSMVAKSANLSRLLGCELELGDGEAAADVHTTPAAAAATVIGVARRCLHR